MAKPGNDCLCPSSCLPEVLEIIVALLEIMANGLFLSSVGQERKGSGSFEKICLCFKWYGYFSCCLLCWAVAKGQQTSFLLPNVEWLRDEITLSEGHLLIHHLCLNS